MADPGPVLSRMPAPKPPREHCNGCDRFTRPTGLYLCGACWFQLPAEARRRLTLKDDQAAARLLSLYRQITGSPKVALRDVAIAP